MVLDGDAPKYETGGKARRMSFVMDSAACSRSKISGLQGSSGPGSGGPSSPSSRPEPRSLSNNGLEADTLVMPSRSSMSMTAQASPRHAPMHGLGLAAAASASITRRREAAAADAVAVASGSGRDRSSSSTPAPQPSSAPTTASLAAALSPAPHPHVAGAAFKASVGSLISKTAAAALGTGHFGSGQSALASMAKAALEKTLHPISPSPQPVGAAGRAAGAPASPSEGGGVNKALERLANLTTGSKPSGGSLSKSPSGGGLAGRTSGTASGGGSGADGSSSDRNSGGGAPSGGGAGGSGRFSLNASVLSGSGQLGDAARSALKAAAGAQQSIGSAEDDGGAGVRHYIPLEDRAMHPHFLMEMVKRGFDSRRHTWSSTDMQNFTTGDIVNCIIKPATARLSLDYVQSAVTGDISLDWCRRGNLLTPAAQGRPSFGPVTYFVSHAWSYKFTELVQLVLEHYQHLPGSEDGEKYLEVYYWVDIFAVTQHFVGQFTDSADSDFPKVIHASKQMLCCALPRLPKPAIFSRVWCLYEILTAVNYEVEVELLMEPMSKVSDTAAFDILDRAVLQLDVRKAQATVQVDYNYIMNHIKKQPGIEEFNRILQDCLRHSMLSAQLKMAVERGHHETALHLIHQRGAHYDYPNNQFHFERVPKEQEKETESAEKAGGYTSNKEKKDRNMLTVPAGDLAAQVLAEMLKGNHTISSVLLRGVSDAGIVALGKGLTTADPKLLKRIALTSLDLSHNVFGPLSAAAFGAVLSHVTSLSSLDLRFAMSLGVNSSAPGGGGGGTVSSSGTPPASKAGGGAPAPKGVTGGGASGGMKGMAAGLATSLSLQVLLLDRCGIDAEGAVVLMDAVATGDIPLTTLSLDYNQILDAGAITLARALTKTRTMTDLSLNACGVGQTGAVALAQALSTSVAMTSIRMTDNAAIGDVGVVALAGAIKAGPGRLRVLHLNNVSMSVVGAVALTDALQAPGGAGVKDLDVADNFDLGRARSHFKKMARNKEVKVVWDDYNTTA